MNIVDDIQAFLHSSTDLIEAKFKLDISSKLSSCKAGKICYPDKPFIIEKFKVIFPVTIGQQIYDGGISFLDIVPEVLKRDVKITFYFPPPKVSYFKKLDDSYGLYPFEKGYLKYNPLLEGLIQFDIGFIFKIPKN